MQPAPRRYTEEEYFALDEAAPEGVRLEYLDGVIYHKGRVYDPSNPELARNMAGGTPEHNRIIGNMTFLLSMQLRERECHLAPSDQQVRLRNGRYVYPDVVASCEPDYNDRGQLLTPQLIVEVLSESTSDEDMGAKLLDYIQIESLREYWVVAQKEVRVTRYYRTDEGWGLHGSTELDDVITSAHLDVQVALRELYRTVF